MGGCQRLGEWEAIFFGGEAGASFQKKTQTNMKDLDGFGISTPPDS